MDAVELGKQALATGLVVKAAVDVYRWVPVASPPWALRVAAIGVGLVAGVAGAYIDRLPMDGPAIVYGLLVGFLGGVGAIAATEVHKWAREEPKPPDQAAGE